MFQLGIDRLLKDSQLRQPLRHRRLAYLGHPASQTHKGTHSLDELMKLSDLKIVSAFGPQHGMKGEKQDNMIETDDYLDPIHQIPVFSLYGKVRRPTPEMLDTFDVLLVDLQDIGTRIYTFLTTLCYMLEACTQAQKEIWILDRPNPAGRPIEGTLLESGWESFVGIGPILMRHGLTLGECALWYSKYKKLNLPLKIVEMQDYDLVSAPGHGWPLFQLPWINPSPNASSLPMTRCFPGTVIIEGTELSEGRGTTHPLELIGTPHTEGSKWLSEMERIAPQWMKGAILRPCYFQPTFHKFSGELCGGFQIHVDTHQYMHEVFKPYRLIILALKAYKNLHPNKKIWREFAYEYETSRLAFDLLNGGTKIRQWVDDSNSHPQDLEILLNKDEKQWQDERRSFLIYT